MRRRACTLNGLTVGAVAAGRAGSCSDQQHWQQRRHDGHCKHGPDTAGRQAHQHQREQRTPDGADDIQSLAQAIGRAPRMVSGVRSATRASRGAPDALADAIQEADAEHGGGAIGKWKERLGQPCQAIAQDHQAFALAQMVAQYPEKTLATARSLRHAFDQPYCHH